MESVTTFWHTDNQLEAEGLRGFRCPWCERVVVGSTPKGFSATEWRWVPWLSKPQKYRCCGCFIDFDAACVSDEFETHPDRESVKSAASKEGMTVEEFRLKFLKQSLLDIAGNLQLTPSLRLKYTDEVQSALRSIGFQ